MRRETAALGALDMLASLEAGEEQPLAEVLDSLVDDTASNTAALLCEAGSRQVFATAYNLTLDTVEGPWYDDLVVLFQALHAVTNNGPRSVGGGGTRRSAVVTKAHRGRDDDERIITERRVHVDAAACTVTRRRLALTLATALALEPATREQSPASAGALTDMVKRSNLGANLGAASCPQPLHMASHHWLWAARHRR